MYYVYILRSELDNSFYVGSTNDIEDRLKRHSEGRSKYTKKKLPLTLVYKEVFGTRSEAINRERYIKNMKSTKYIGTLLAS
jgi:putative endonuclease